MAVDIESIKAANPLPDTIERMTGERIERHKIRCPFHEDRTPSLQVYDDGGWKCFGCGKHGDVIDFLGYLWYGENYNFQDVIDRLGAIQIAPLPARTARPKPKPPATRLNIGLEQLSAWNEMPAARRMYWHSRGLNDRTIDEFFLGWDGRRYVIPALYRLQVFGVKRRQSEIDDGYEAKYTQITGSRVGIFNADNLWEARQVIICEGEIDCMLLHQAGFIAVTSTGGAGSWRADWARFFTYIKDIRVLFDNDEAGRKGAYSIAKSIRRSKVLSLPEEVKDIGELFDKSSDPVAWLKANTR